MSYLEPVVMVSSLLLLMTQIALCYALLRALGRLGPMADRVAQFSDALSLLAETTETGFRSTALELQRIRMKSERVGDFPNTTTTARVAAAARRGRSLPEIAAKERISEGEVRLRLSMSEQAKAAEKASPARKPAPKAPAAPALSGHAAVVAKAVRKVREARARNNGSLRA